MSEPREVRNRELLDDLTRFSAFDSMSQEGRDSLLEELRLPHRLLEGVDRRSSGTFQQIRVSSVATTLGFSSEDSPILRLAGTHKGSYKYGVQELRRMLVNQVHLKHLKAQGSFTEVIPDWIRSFESQEDLVDTLKRLTDTASPEFFYLVILRNEAVAKYGKGKRARVENWTRQGHELWMLLPTSNASEIEKAVARELNRQGVGRTLAGTGIEGATETFPLMHLEIAVAAALREHARQRP
jgi:hypothetical protein